MWRILQLKILFKEPKAAVFGLRAYIESRWLFLWIKGLIIIGLFLHSDIFVAITLSYLLLDKELSNLFTCMQAWVWNRILEKQVQK